MKLNIPFYNLTICHEQIRKSLLEAFEATLDGSDFILGEHVRKFESNFSTYTNSAFAIGVSNGLDALILSLKALGVGVGDEVIIPAHTYIATALAVTAVGGKPVLVEPNEDTFNIDVSKIEEVITSRTKVIIAVHLYGNPADMDEILCLADKHNLKVIEDNAQAQGAKYKGKVTGGIGHLGATSLYPGKNLGALGDAGVITTSDPSYFRKIMLLRNYGSIKKYSHEIIGFNMRLDELQAALLNVKIQYLELWNSQRNEIAQFYFSNIQNELIKLPRTETFNYAVFHQFVVRSQRRDDLVRFLKLKGIETLIHYPTPIHLQKAYSGLNLKKGSLPITETLSEQILSIPIWPGLDMSSLNYIVDSLNEFN